MGFEDEMAQYDETWEAEQKAAGILADGDYSGAVITEMSLDERDDRFAIVAKFVVEGAGSARKWWNLDDAERIGWAARDFKRLGYVGKISEIRTPIESGEFLGLVCRIKVETKPGNNGRDYTNVWLNGVEGKGEVPASARASAGAGSTLPPDDDIPF